MSNASFRLHCAMLAVGLNCKNEAVSLATKMMDLQEREYLWRAMENDAMCA